MGEVVGDVEFAVALDEMIQLVVHVVHHHPHLAQCLQQCLAVLQGGGVSFDHASSDTPDLKKIALNTFEKQTLNKSMSDSHYFNNQH